MSVSWGVNFWDHQQRFIVKKYHFTSFLKNQGGQLPTFSVRIPFPKISFISLANKVSKEQMRFSDVAHVRATQKKYIFLLMEFTFITLVLLFLMPHQVYSFKNSADAWLHCG